MGEVWIVSGSDHYRRERLVRQLVASKEGSPDWRIEYADAKKPGALDNATAGMALFDANVLVVVENPEALPPDTYEEHLTAGPDTVTLLLNHEGEPDRRTKFAKWIEQHRDIHRGFTAPKPWDEIEVGAKFVVEEAQYRQKQFDPPDLAGALVRRVGTELGFLSFEVMKLAALTTALGTDTILPEHLRAVMSEVSEAGMQPILDALALRDRKRLAAALAHTEKTSSVPPSSLTMKAARILAPTALNWMSVSALLAEGRQASEMASVLGLNPWFLANKILPAASRWPRQDAIRLVRLLAASERAVFDGHLDPWTELSAGLLQIVR